VRVDPRTETSTLTAEDRSEGPSRETAAVPARHRAFGGLARGWRFELVFLVSTLSAVVLILSYVYRRGGFPVTQAYGNDFLLTDIYAAHLRHGDIFPVWSTSDAYGLGSPVLLFYQRAFFYVSGALYALLGGALKTSLVLTIAVFLILGAYGMRLAIATLTDRRSLLVVGSVGFLFTNYVFTDWLARGDLAEFSALMVVPWLLYWCLKFVTKCAVSFLIVPIFVLLFLAHNAIALLSLFLLIVTIAVFVATFGLRGLRQVLWRLGISVVGTAVLLAPIFVAELKFSKYYDPGVKVHSIFANVFQDFADPLHYVYDGSYRWNVVAKNPQDFFTVQLDFAITFSILLGGILVLHWWSQAHRKGVSFRIGRYFNLPALAVLGISTIIYMFLQLSVSSEVYRLFAVLQVIDYPSRSLAFVTPMGVLLCVAIAEAISRRYPKNRVLAWLPAPWFASLVLLSPLTWSSLPPFGVTLPQPGGHPGKVEYLPSTEVFVLPRYASIGRPFVGITQLDGTSFPADGTLFPEYLPKVTTPGGEEVLMVGPLYTRFVQEGRTAQPLDQAQCSAVEPARTPIESLSIELRVKCDRPTRLALPITYNAYTSITSLNANGTSRPVPYFHIPTDPRIIIDVRSDQAEILQVSLPTIWRVLF
jgi:hypothetical protein